MMITIDGPAGAGKSSVARGLAERLGFRFLDTGAMYRAVAWAALQASVDWRDDTQLVDIAQRIELTFRGQRVYVDGHDVTEAIRTTAVTEVIHFVADCPGVRRRLVELQRSVTAGGDYVTEGRDQGTVVFPDAECKIFLTASAEERAQRRQRELLERGESPSFGEVLDQQNQRDQRDSARPVGALLKADDAIEIVTDGMDLPQVLATIEATARQQLGLDTSHQA